MEKNKLKKSTCFPKSSCFETIILNISPSSYNSDKLTVRNKNPFYFPKFTIL